MPKKKKEEEERAHLFSHLSSNVSQPLLPIEAHGLNTPVSQHFDDLGIFLTVFTEHEFALVVFVLVFSPPSVLSTLFMTVKTLIYF